MDSVEAITLREYFERLLEEKEKRDDQRFKAQESANALALTGTKEALTVALTAVKETNSAAVEASRILVAKTEQFADEKISTHNNIKPWVESLIAAQIAKIDTLDRSTATKFETLERRIARFENREEGVTLTTKLIMGAAAFLATLLTIYFSLHK